MSLKGFHIIFVFLAVLCMVGFWAWTQWNLDDAQSLGVVELGKGSFGLGLGLFVYWIWFVVKKSKTIIV